MALLSEIDWGSVILVKSLIKEIIEFTDDRKWNQFHNPKDIAISLTLEASELLENFQWKENDEAIEQNYENIKDELADVLIYVTLLSDNLDINLEDAIQEKLKKNNEKYPIDKAKGSKKKYTEL